MSGRRAVDSSRYINRSPDLWEGNAPRRRRMGWPGRAHARARGGGESARGREEGQLRGDLGIRRITSKCLLTHGYVRQDDTASSAV